jgi:cation transport ATPase
MEMKTKGFKARLAHLAAANSGLRIVMSPILRMFFGRKGFVVISAVTEESVGMDTLDRCAAIAAAQANDPIFVCLRRHCGDVAAPPDRFQEVEGLGVSAQFSGQMIHLGNAEYLNKLEIETPGVSGEAVFVALEGRLLGYYRLLNLEGKKPA